MSLFITDRDQSHVDRANELRKKGWANMTAEERQEWSGDPLLFEGANLVRNTYMSDGLTLDFGRDCIVITPDPSVESPSASIDLFSCTAFGEYTECMLSATRIEGSCKISVYKYVGGSKQYYDNEYIDENKLSSKFNCYYDDTTAWTYALNITATDAVKIYGLSVTKGGVARPYKPYTPIVATNSTKGAYNHSDLNRVGMAVKEIGEKLGVEVDAKTDWSMWDIPTDNQLKRYLYNVSKVRSAFNGSTPSVPSSMASLSYEKANDIEKVLSTIEITYESTRRCGEIYCGEV